MTKKIGPKRAPGRPRGLKHSAESRSLMKAAWGTKKSGIELLTRRNIAVILSAVRALLDEKELAPNATRWDTIRHLLEQLSEQIKSSNQAALLRQKNG